MALEKTILLIEDNPDDEALTLRALKQHRVMNRVVVARDGAEGLDYLLGTEAKPQVVLLDLKLPKIDGLEVLRRVRSDSRTKLVPIVILTSSEEDHDITQSYRSGANSYVRKPVDFIQFSEAIRELGLYWLLLNQAPPHP